MVQTKTNTTAFPPSPSERIRNSQSDTVVQFGPEAATNQGRRTDFASSQNTQNSECFLDLL